MNKMFPNDIKWNLKNVTCEICELAKHKRTTYVPSNNILTNPLMIVHYDAWCLTSRFCASLKHKDDGQTKFIKPNSQRQDIIIKYWVSIGSIHREQG